MQPLPGSVGQKRLGAAVPGGKAYPRPKACSFHGSLLFIGKIGAQKLPLHRQPGGGQGTDAQPAAVYREPPFRQPQTQPVFIKNNTVQNAQSPSGRRSGIRQGGCKTRAAAVGTARAASRPGCAGRGVLWPSLSLPSRALYIAQPMLPYIWRGRACL